jgi:hypothetical protein
VIAVDSQCRDPDPTTARKITKTMTTISNETTERVKRWPTALKNVEDTCITKLWIKSNRAWTHHSSIFEEWETKLRDKLQKQTLARQTKP